MDSIISNLDVDENLEVDEDLPAQSEVEFARQSEQEPAEEIEEYVDISSKYNLLRTNSGTEVEEDIISSNLEEKKRYDDDVIANDGEANLVIEQEEVVYDDVDNDWEVDNCDNAEHISIKDDIKTEKIVTYSSASEVSSSLPAAAISTPCAVVDEILENTDSVLSRINNTESEINEDLFPNNKRDPVEQSVKDDVQAVQNDVQEGVQAERESEKEFVQAEQESVKEDIQAAHGIDQTEPARNDPSDQIEGSEVDASQQRDISTVPRAVPKSVSGAARARQAEAAERAVRVQQEREQQDQEQQREDKAAALRQRAAKRQEEQERREKREAAKARKIAAAAERAVAECRVAEGVVEAAPGADSADPGARNGGDNHKSKQTHLERAGRGHAVKLRKVVKEHKQDSEQEGEGEGEERSADMRSDWNDSLSPVPHPSVKSRHEAVEQRRRERLEARQRRLAVEQREGKGEENGSTGPGDVEVEGGRAALHHSAAKPSRSSRSHNAKRRPGAEGDGARLVLPPLVQPRSSPAPNRSSLQGLFEDSDSAARVRRPRKPLYQRMIEQAQQQYIEEERQKHETYLQQRKLKQRSNPTAEELRAHRRKHDELVQAKLEEGRRSLAEAAAANARALKRQQAAAAAVHEALEEDKDSGKKGQPLVVDGTSPAHKRKAPKKKSSFPPSSDKATAAASRHSEEMAEDHGFSPSKSSAGISSRSGSAERHASLGQAGTGDDGAGSYRVHCGSSLSKPPDASSPGSGASRGDRGGGVGEQRAEPQLAEPRHVSLQFDQSAAAAAVRRIPSLDAQAIPAYCASDWIDVLSGADPEEGQPVTIGSSSAQVLAPVLRPVPPHSDAQKLMNLSVA